MTNASTTFGVATALRVDYTHATEEAGVHAVPYVSADFMIEFARIRLKQVDGTLTRLLEKMKAAQAETSALNDAISFLTSRANGWNDHEAQALAEKTILAAAEKLPAGSATRATLTGLATDSNSKLKTNGAGGADTSVMAKEIEAIITDLQNLMKTVDRNTSEDQLMVNKEMGARNEVLQLAAQLIQSLNDTIKAIQQRS